MQIFKDKTYITGITYYDRDELVKEYESEFVEVEDGVKHKDGYTYEQWLTVHNKVEPLAKDSVVIDDKSETAKKILAGSDFEVNNGVVTIKENKKKEDKEKKRVKVIEDRNTKREELRTLVIDKKKKKEKFTQADIENIIAYLADQLITPEEETNI